MYNASMAHKNKASYNEYQKKYQLERYHKRRNDAITMLGGKCFKCESTQNLQFDHIKAIEKSFGVSKLWSISEKSFLQEIQKCQLLCETCHIEKSKYEGDYGGGHNKNKNFDSHGTGSRYAAGCRCDDCCLWKKQYRHQLVSYSGV
jgi:5-methylcytosine-specific restriction endonuclease McrA